MDEKSALKAAVCRCCLSSNDKMHSLENNDLKIQYSTVTSIQMSDLHSLPGWLCGYCRLLLNRCIDFKRKCLQSNEYLLDSLCNYRHDLKRNLAHFENKQKIFDFSPIFYMHIDPVVSLGNIAISDDKNAEVLPLADGVVKLEGDTVDNEIANDHDNDDIFMDELKDDFEGDDWDNLDNVPLRMFTKVLENADKNDAADNVEMFDDNNCKDAFFNNVKKNEICGIIDRNSEININEQTNADFTFTKGLNIVQVVQYDETLNKRSKRTSSHEDGDKNCLKKERRRLDDSINGETERIKRKYIKKSSKKHKKSKREHGVKRKSRRILEGAMDLDYIGDLCEIKQEDMGEVKPRRRRKCDDFDPSVVTEIVLTEEQQKEDMINNRLKEEYINAPYKCEMCSKGFSLEITYNTHTLRHSDSSGCHACHLCQLRFTSVKNLKQHYDLHSRKYMCNVCKRLLNNRHGAHRHYEVEHGENRGEVFCTVCGKHSRNKYALKKHMKVHNSSKNYQCSLCPKTFLRVTQLKTHLSRHTGDKPFKCSMCDLMFISTSARRCHELVHTDSKEFYCVECDHSFRSKNLLAQHLRKGAKHVTPDLMTYACDKCERRYVTNRDLKQHMNSVHLKIRAHACNICPATFMARNSLRSHVKHVHEGFKRPKDKICDICGRGFTEKRLLLEHKHTHTGERPYACNQCDARFGQAASMHTHNKIVHLKVGRGKQFKTDSMEPVDAANELNIP